MYAIATKSRQLNNNNDNDNGTGWTQIPYPSDYYPNSSISNADLRRININEYDSV